MRPVRNQSNRDLGKRTAGLGIRLGIWGCLFSLAPLIALSAASEDRVLRTSDFSQAAECGKCHPQVYRQWRVSMHANSFADPVYRAVFERMIAATGRRNQIFCLSCHTPVATATGSVLSQPSPLKWKGFDAPSAEGVTCDFCHTIAANPRLRGRILVGGYQIPVDAQTVKFGIHKDAKSQFHPVRTSPLLESSEFCATCHSFKHPVLATEIQNTYQEWLASSYAKSGVQCQDCHMPATAAEGDGDRPMMRSHGVEGGRGALIERALTLTLGGNIERSGGLRTLRVTATIANTGAGHRVPTGIPGIRELWLELDVRQGDNSIASGRFALSQRLLDENGGEALPWEAYTLVDDNRIRPGETVEKTMEVPLLSGLTGKLDISGRLLYQMVSRNVSRRLDLPSEPPREIKARTLEVANSTQPKGKR